jgi:hypothetical protein
MERPPVIWDIPDCFLPALGSDDDDPSHEAFHGVILERERAYAARIQSTVPVSVQYSRLDTSRGRTLASPAAVSMAVETS